MKIWATTRPNTYYWNARAICSFIRLERIRTCYFYSKRLRHYSRSFRDVHASYLLTHKFRDNSQPSFVGCKGILALSYHSYPMILFDVSTIIIRFVLDSKWNEECFSFTEIVFLFFSVLNQFFFSNKCYDFFMLNHFVVANVTQMVLRTIKISIFSSLYVKN